MGGRGENDGEREGRGLGWQSGGGSPFVILAVVPVDALPHQSQTTPESRSMLGTGSEAILQKVERRPKPQPRQTCYA